MNMSETWKYEPSNLCGKFSLATVFMETGSKLLTNKQFMKLLPW